MRVAKTTEKVERGSETYKRINLAFFAAGFVTFLTLYDVQPLLPVFTREFQVQAATGSLPLSLSTATMAVSMLFAGSASDTWGRKPVMVTSLFVTSIVAILTSLTHTFSSLLALRLIQGVALGGLPAVAMAYLGEEISAASLGSAMGLYIGGNAMGGMTGRIYTATMCDFFPWRVAIGTIGIACLMLSIYFVKNLPPSAHFTKRRFAGRYLYTSFLGHLRDRKLLTLYAIIFLTMGAFVTLFNYITFRLLQPPYRLSQMQISWIFLVYLLGSCSSAAAGDLVRRFGRGKVLWMSLATMILGTAATLLAPLPFVVAGIAIFTCGFFGGHSVASTWVGSRAETAKAQASALYLFFYYLGSSLSGTAGGFFWAAHRWEGVAGLIVGLLGLAVFLSVRLAQTERAAYAPLPASEEAEQALT